MVTPDVAYDQLSDMNVPELLIRESVIWLYPYEVVNRDQVDNAPQGFNHNGNGDSKVNFQ